MGSSLGITLAIFFLAQFENKFMAEFHDFTPVLYLQYDMWMIYFVVSTPMWKCFWVFLIIYTLI